jgi:iron(III) transport system ATP-binding protein
MPGQGEPLIVKTVSRQLWRPGAAVRIEVVGEARVFAR